MLLLGEIVTGRSITDERSVIQLQNDEEKRGISRKKTGERGMGLKEIGFRGISLKGIGVGGVSLKEIGLRGIAGKKPVREE